MTNNKQCESWKTIESEFSRELDLKMKSKLEKQKIPRRGNSSAGIFARTHKRRPRSSPFPTLTDLSLQSLHFLSLLQ